jgi:S1-C subfamily serine protease
VNSLDLVILAGTALAALGGYRLGFVARVTSWIGLALGLGLAAHFLPNIVDAIHVSSPSSRLLIAAAVLIGGAFVGQALGLIVGAQIHRVIPMGPLRLADRAVGGLVGALGVIVSVWLLLPSAADVPGGVARLARGSKVAHLIDSNFPAAPNTLQALRRLVGNDNFPRVFEGLQQAPDIGPPPAASGLSTAALARVQASTVRVEGQACDRLQDGSGFAVATDTVVTNAHVVAGERHTFVYRPDGAHLPATVVAFDSDRDLAVLQVPQLGEAPLTVGSGKVGDSGAVFGHPNGVPQIVVAPATISRQVEAVGRDLYDSHQTKRDVYILASQLHPGDSGGALVDTGGTVVGVAFAIAPDRPGTAYALTTKELEPVLALPRTTTTSTGPCISNG